MSRARMRAFPVVLGLAGIGTAFANVAGCGSTTGASDAPVGAPDRDGGTPPSEGQDASTAPTCDLPTAVDDVLKTRCQSCHGTTTEYGAPFSLVTYDDLTRTGADGAKIYERVQVRIHDEQNPMPPSTVPNARLTTDETKAIDDWIAAGVPKSTGTCGTSQAPPDLGPKPLACQPGETRLTIRPKTAYKVGKDVKNVYTCAGVEVPLDQSMHITAIGPHVDKKEVLHHLLLMQSQSAVSQTPYVCGGAGVQEWTLLSGWAPGGDNMILPAEAGFPIDQKTHWVIQAHYNNAKGEQDYEDQSGFDVCATPNKRKYDAGVIAFGSMAFSIPPHAKYQTTCALPIPPGLMPKGATSLKLFRSWPHMHNLGYAMKTTVKSGVGGTEKTLVDDTNFNFQNQGSFDADIDLKPGDVVTTTCRWNNTTDRTVSWGENTEDEMCYNYTAYFPTTGVNWMAGSANPACNSGVEK